MSAYEDERDDVDVDLPEPSTDDVDGGLGGDENEPWFDAESGDPDV